MMIIWIFWINIFFWLWRIYAIETWFQCEKKWYNELSFAPLMMMSITFFLATPKNKLISYKKKVEKVFDFSRYIVSSKFCGSFCVETSENKFFVIHSFSLLMTIDNNNNGQWKNNIDKSKIKKPEMIQTNRPIYILIIKKKKHGHFWKLKFYFHFFSVYVISPTITMFFVWSTHDDVKWKIDFNKKTNKQTEFLAFSIESKV